MSVLKMSLRSLIRPVLAACFTAMLAAPVFAHDESLYGKALAYGKVDGIPACSAVEVVGDRLYAIGQGVLWVLDITLPEKPRVLGKLGGLGNTRQLVIRGTTAFITARQDGWWMVDIADASKPVLISHYDTVEMATGIWVSGDVVFIATRCYGVEIVDVSDPRQVRNLSTLKTGEAQSCWARDGLLYIGDWAPKKLLVADVHDPRAPKIIGEGALDGYGDGGCLRGKYCYAVTGHHSRSDNKVDTQGHGHGLEIFDVSKPTAPVRVSGVKFPAGYHLQNDMWTARVAGDHCVVADTYNGLFVVNVSDVTKPVIVAHAQLPMVESRKDFDPIGGLALAKDVIYAAGIYSGLYVVPAKGLADPVVEEKDTPPVLTESKSTAASDSDFVVYQPAGQVHSVTVQGDIAWAACGAAGIQAVRLGDKLEPVMTHHGKGDAWHVSVAGNRLFAAESAEGLAIYDIGKDMRLTEVGRLMIPGQAVKQVAAPAPSKFAILHCGSSAIYIADLTDPKNPKVALKDSQVGLFYGDQLVDELFDGRYLCAHWHRSGPGWYDVGGAVPKWTGNTPDTSNYSWTDGACAMDGRLLIVKHGKYSILNPNEKRSASELPAYGIDGTYLSGRPSVGGSTLVVTSRHQRTVQVVDISDVSHPKLVRKFEISGHPGACAFWRGRMVIPAAYQGLLLERK
ncbi:MAG: hypothetical protein R3F13_11450 [Prosthecobacter sp.]